MKIKFKPSGIYKEVQTTQNIMFHLTIGLLIVFAYVDVYYYVKLGPKFAVRAMLLLFVSIVTSFITEIIWCYFNKKKIKEFITSSFPWVTAIILTMMCQVHISYYSLIVSTVFAILFGKLIFGGFGQNIFNPAGFGRAVFASSFGASKVADFITEATPVTNIAALNWFVKDFNTFVDSKGLFDMFLGFRLGSMGETASLMIILVAIYLCIKKVIDYRIPLVYLSTLFITTYFIGLLNGQNVDYAIFHVLAGGAIFGAVFMLTDPVTSPTSIPGRLVFSMGAAFFTVLIRINASLPEGVVFSILLMNMFTPLLEKVFDGNRFKNSKKNLLLVVSIFVIGLLICTGMAYYKLNTLKEVMMVVRYIL